MATNAAFNTGINIGQVATASIDQYNYSLTESRASSGARLVNSPVQLLVNFNETGDITADVNALANNTQFQDLRNLYQADIVVLLTNGNYPTARGAVRVVDATNAADAYAIVEIGAATSANTFAHEIGHLFGGAHENDFRTQIQPYAHGYYFERRRWPSVRRYSTLMHTRPDGVNYSRILRYSTPNVRFDDELLGNTHTNNVTRRIGERQASINAFRPPFSGLSTYIEGPSYVSLYQPNSWEAVYSCGTGPYSFEWAFSSDGYNYYNAGSGETVSGVLYQCDEYLYIRLTVRSADGQVATAYTTAYTDACGYPYRTVSDQPGFVSNAEQVSLLDARPNPAVRQSEIGFFLPKAQIAKLEVLTPAGHVVNVLADGMHPAGPHSRQVNGQQLPSGVYFYRLTTDGFSQTKKLIITR
jgi:hypothetical protein